MDLWRCSWDRTSPILFSLWQQYPSSPHNKASSASDKQRFIITPIKGSWVVLISMVLFKIGVMIEVRTGCLTCKWRVLIVLFGSTCLGVIQRRYRVSHNNPWHYCNRSHCSLMPDNLVTKCLHDCQGMDEYFGIELGNHATLRHNFPVPKIHSNIEKAIEDLHKEAVGVPMKQRHPSNTLVPMYPIRIIDNSIRMRRIWQRIGWGLLLEQIAVMIALMLMHTLEKLTIDVILLMQDIAVIPFVLWESVKPITFSKVAFTSVCLSRSTRQLFFWGRKVYGLIECASFLKLVTFLVANFPWSIWDARTFDMTQNNTWDKRILV